MRFSLDTEFRDHRGGTELISIAMVADDGREFYAISSEFDRAAAVADGWLKQNVLPYLEADDAPKPAPLAVIADELAEFCASCDDGRRPQVWAWNGAYDFYLLVKLYGRLVDVPEAVPTDFRDLKQWARQLGNITAPAQDGAEHNALFDARHGKVVWEFLSRAERGQRTRRDERVRARLVGAIATTLRDTPVS
jgi:hypothetical protein